LIIRKPKYFKLLKKKYIYTLGDLAAEFGGWMGVLFGYSLLDLGNIILDAIVFLAKSWVRPG